jgi:transposase-like protein
MGYKLKVKTDKEKLALVKSFKESGIPRKEYCIQHGISLATFYNWSKKFRETELNRQEKFIPVVIHASAKRAEQDFVKNTEIEISYPNGVRVKLNQEMDLPMLRSLIGIM